MLRWDAEPDVQVWGMSDTSEASSQPRPEIRFGTVVRLFAVALGIMSATLLAVNGFEIPINEAFVQILRGVRELVGTVLWPLDQLVVTPAVDWLHTHEVQFDLHDHWKSVFVLLWILYAAWARSMAHLADAWTWAFVWFWAGFCALVASVLAATVPLAHAGVLWWPSAGIALYFWGQFAWLGQGFRSIGRIWLIFAVGLASVAIVAPSIPLFRTLESPGLAALAIIVAGLGAEILIRGVIYRRERDGATLTQQIFRNPAFGAGLDILAILSATVFVVWLGNALR